MTGNSISHHPSTSTHMLLQVNSQGTLKTLQVDVTALSHQDVRLIHTLSHLQRKPILEVGALQLPHPHTLTLSPFLWDEGSPAEQQLHAYLECNRQLARNWQQLLAEDNGQHIAFACIVAGLVLLCMGPLISPHVAAAGMIQALLVWINNDVMRMLLGVTVAVYGCVLMRLHRKEHTRLLDPTEARRILLLSRQILHPSAPRIS